MAELDLDAIEARAQAARPGPWGVHDNSHDLTRWIHSEDGTLNISFGYVGNRSQEDAEFVATARTDVPALVAELRQARQRIEELERDRAGRPDWSDGRDLAIRLRDEQATDAEIRDAFWGLWGGAA